MALNSGNKIIRQHWDLIIMPEMLIDWNILGGNKPKLLTFTDRYGCIIGYLETSVVGANSYEVEVEFLGLYYELEEEDI